MSQFHFCGFDKVLWQKVFILAYNSTFQSNISKSQDRETWNSYSHHIHVQEQRERNLCTLLSSILFQFHAPDLEHDATHNGWRLPTSIHVIKTTTRHAQMTLYCVTVITKTTLGSHIRKKNGYSFLFCFVYIYKQFEEQIFVSKIVYIWMSCGS